MIIDIDGRVLEVPSHIEAKMSEQVIGIVAEMFGKIDGKLRFAAKFAAREELKKLEQAVNAAGYDGKALVRPPDGADPVLHYLRIRMRQFEGVFKDAILCIDTEEDSDSITAFALSIPSPNESGGSVAITWDKRVGENDSGEIVRSGPGQTLPEKSPLHL